MGAKLLLSRLIPGLTVLTLLACGAPSGQVGSKPGQSSTTQPTSTPPDPRRTSTILDFQAKKLGGGTFDGNDLVGKDVAIWFWAPW